MKAMKVMKTNRILIFEDFKYMMSLSDLKSILNKYSIPIDNWGKGQSKGIENLLDEVNNKDCILKEENGTIVRYINFVGVNVFFNEDGQKLKLVEDRQVFKDGRVRRRTMQSSVSEKMKIGEDPLESAIRGVGEELNIVISKSQLAKLKEISYTEDSHSYPGIITKYNGYRYKLLLDKSQYVSTGYVEVQSDKSTFFMWKKY
jgi:hypothetical protein